MSHDPYAPCLCGSGKKLKFCCQDILADLQRISRLRENQPDVAERQIRELYERHPDREQLASLLASIIVESGRLEEGKQVIIDFLRRRPDHPHALLSLADLCLATDGFEPSRRLVHRAMQLGARSYPSGVALLCRRIARECAASQYWMAARAHISLAARLSGREERMEDLSLIHGLEVNPLCFYPLRGQYALKPVQTGTLLEEDEVRAQKLSRIGCWEPASILYKRIAEAAPENGAYWFNLGLCRAWDARTTEAAEALSRAAELFDDFTDQVEAETLAQLLKLEADGKTSSVFHKGFPVRELSAVVTRLNDHGRAALRGRPEGNDEDDGPRPSRPGMKVVAEYEWLDREISEDDDFRSGDLPLVPAEIIVEDIEDAAQAEAAGMTQPVVWIVADEQESAEALAAIRELLADYVSEDEDDTFDGGGHELPLVCRRFEWRRYIPDSLSMDEIREREDAFADSVLEEWMDEANETLDGKTPREAAEDSSLHYRLAASVFVLDAAAHRMNIPFSPAGCREKLGLPDLHALQTGSEESVTDASFLRNLMYVPEQLSAQQLSDLVRRTSLVQYYGISLRVAEALADNTEALAVYGSVPGWLYIAHCRSRSGDVDGCNAALDSARAAADDTQDAFRTKLEIDIRDLSLRLARRIEEPIVELLHKIRDRYAVKIPAVLEVVREQLVDSKLENLLSEVEPTVAATAGKLWTPEQGSAAADAEGDTGEEGGKLWLPGQ